MPSLLDPKLEHGRAILLEAYAGEQILGVRTSRYLYTEWDGDKNRCCPSGSSTTCTPTRISSTTSPATRPMQPVVNQLGNELDQLIDCAGATAAGRRSAP